jgi:hypothetical protein
MLNLVIDSMKKIIVFFALTALVLSCDKDKFETVPTLKVVSTSSDIIPKNGLLRVTLEFTDKEGDVTDSVILLRKRMNLKNTITSTPIKYSIPVHPTATKAEITVDLEYQNGLVFGFPAINIPGTNPTQYERDTMQLKFVVKDAAGNKSDTATANVIVIR